jgi:hypothetical protein
LGKTKAAQSERPRARGQGSWTRKLLILLNLAIVLVLIGGFILLAVLVAPWTWPLVGAPILYVVGASLYSLQSKLLIPAWLAQSIEVSATIWPPIKWLATTEEVRAANEALIDSFDRTLNEYKLESISEAKREGLARRALRLKVPMLATEWTQEQGADPRSVDALELLHRERCGERTFSLWQAGKEKNELVETLATLVQLSERLPKADDTHSFDDADVRALLEALRDFEVEVLADELRAVNRLAGRLQRYAQFVKTDPKKAASANDGITSLIRKHGGQLPAGASTMFRLESPAVALKLMEAIEECGDQSLGAVHRGVFLAENEIDPGALRERACAEALQQRRTGGKDDPVRVLQAYLWEKYRRGTATQITCAELDSKWRTWSSEAMSELGSGKTGGSYDGDLDKLADRLNAGVWPIHRTAPDKREPYPILLPVRMPEHDEIRDLDAYLITFDDQVGPVAELVDRLRDERPIYRFGPYTRRTRLGIVPRGMPFHEFLERFFADLDGALHRYRFESEGERKELNEVEVTVNRIDLAHCRELWLGDTALEDVMRTPSVYNVWHAIEGQLDEDQRPSAEAAFKRVAGDFSSGPIR